MSWTALCVCDVLFLPACWAPPAALTRLLADGLLQGRLTLLLGPPGAGKSVLLQTLAGQLRPSKGVRVRRREKEQPLHSRHHQVGMLY